jgi:hypothetical protein
VLFVLGLVALSAVTGLDPSRVFCTGVGAAVVVLALWRPWWFWGHPTAVMVRRVLGDRGMQALYLAVGLAGLLVGLLTKAPW